ASNASRTMSDAFHEYDPDQVDILFGLAPLSGFSEEDMVTIEEDNENFITVIGVDGQATRSKQKARIATITVKLMSSSSSNAYLSAVLAAHLLASGGAGVVPFLIRDRNGTSLFATDKAWISKVPPVTYSSKAGP